VCKAIPGQAVLKCPQPSPIIPLHHIPVVSCTFYTIPISPIFNLENFYLLVHKSQTY